MLQEQKFLESRISKSLFQWKQKPVDREIWSSLHGRFPWEHESYLLVTLKCYNGTSKCFQEQGKNSWSTWKVYSDTRKTEDLKSL
jgi:hypothetical protein